MSREIVRETAAEFLGTFVLMTFGVAVVAQVVLTEKVNGEYLSINLGWGMAVALAVYVAGGVSGAHINPAVTLAVAVHRDFPWRKVPYYMVAQMLGAFVASAVVYVAYREALDNFIENARGGAYDLTTAGIWATYPADYLTSFPGGLIDQIVGTAMLVLCVFALTDERNIAPQSNIAPLLIGGVVLTVGMTFGANAGYAINPARDLAPRFFTYIAGWGSQVFTAAGKDGVPFWWVPIVGPLVGGVLGGYIYDGWITRFHPPQTDGD